MVPITLPLPDLSSPVVLLPDPVSPAWKSIPTAREVPDTGTRASDLSLGSRGMPRIPSWTEYRRKEPTPATDAATVRCIPQTTCCPFNGQPQLMENRDSSSVDEHKPGRGGWRAQPCHNSSTTSPWARQMAQDSRVTGRAELNHIGWTCQQAVRLPEASLHRQPLCPPLG